MIFVDIMRLCLALVALPDVRPATACTAAVAITIAHEEFDPLLLAAISYQEARFSPAAMNPRTGCGGTMGVRRWRGGSALDGYRAGVVVLREASRWCARRGTPGRTCMLSAYASGPHGPRLGLYRQPRAVLRRMAFLCSVVGRHGVARDARTGGCGPMKQRPTTPFYPEAT